MLKMSQSSELVLCESEDDVIGIDLFSPPVSIDHHDVVFLGYKKVEDFLGRQPITGWAYPFGFVITHVGQTLGRKIFSFFKDFFTFQAHIAISYMNMSIEFLKEQLKEIDWEKCSVGEPIGSGLLIGYEGWGSPHVLINPADPLDAQLDRIGLFGKFQEVNSKGLLHMLHGDCTFTHGLLGLCRLLRPGGTIFVEFMAIAEVLRIAIQKLDSWDFVTAQILEKMCFLPPIDKSRLLFPQTMISKEKVRNLLYEAGLSKIETFKDIDKITLPLFPDLIKLGDVPNEVWTASATNFKMEESLSVDRPTCVLCDRVVTKRDHDRRFFSRYCKDHYQEGRILCDAELRNAFTIIIKATKPGVANAS